MAAIATFLHAIGAIDAFITFFSQTLKPRLHEIFCLNSVDKWPRASNVCPKSAGKWPRTSAKALCLSSDLA